MKTFTFVIGTSDDFEDLTDLLAYVEMNGRGGAGCLNYSAFEFDVPLGLDKFNITMIGRGIAFSSDWCMDDTFSAVIDGCLEPETRKQDVDDDDASCYAAPV